MKKIVIAVDSFKNCLTAAQVSEVIAHALRDAYQDCNIVTLPVSDGGEGLTDVLVRSLGGLYHEIDVVDPLMRPIKCKIGAVDRCAIIETASAIGLERLTEEERNPLNTTSYGLGLMINAAYDLGYRKMLVGLGGTATVDAGLGAMQALGVRFYNRFGRVVPQGITGEQLVDVEQCDMLSAKRKFRDVEFNVACDVTNPILGSKGAATVFGPQKGATRPMVQKLNTNISHVCHMLRHYGFENFENTPGTGAAGGLGMAFLTFMGSRLSSGIDSVLDQIKFNDEIEDADLVITGEGHVDAQSFMGKALYGIVRRVRAAKINLLVIGGRVSDRDILDRSGIKNPLAVTPDDMSDEEALRPDVAMKNIYDRITEWVANQAPAN